MLYLNICRLISVDISQGYLFHATSKAGQISDKPFIGSSVYSGAPTRTSRAWDTAPYP